VTPHRRTATTALKGIFWTGVTVLALAGCSQNPYSSNGGSTEVSQAAWTGSEWPFTVPNGILGCTKPGTVTFNADDTVYGLNGIALDHGYPAVDPIWKSATPGSQADLGPMIQKGLTLCGTPS
jgi:Protein of unknown function (DUF2511)